MSYKINDIKRKQELERQHKELMSDPQYAKSYRNDQETSSRKINSSSKNNGISFRSFK